MLYKMAEPTLMLSIYRQHESRPCHLEEIIIIKCIADWQLIGVVGVVTHCTDNDITLNV